MKILHIVADHSTASGGVFQMIEAMGQSMLERGHQVQVLCTGNAEERGSKLSRDAFKRTVPQSLYASREFRRQVEDYVRETDVVHVHSNWTLPVWWGCGAAVRQKRGLIHSPHGALCLASLQHHALGKHLVSPLDRRALGNADRILASGSFEAEWIRKWMPSLAERIVVIPPGISRIESSSDSGPRLKQIVYAGRLHPMKGIDLLLPAWARLRLKNPELAQGWQIVLAGGDSGGYRAQLEALAETLALRESIRFTGSIDRGACLELLQASGLAVLPSYSENFGLVVAEAMACGTPMITTAATPWEGVLNRKSEQAGWVVEATVQGLETALVEALGIPDSLRREMGARGREIVENEFSWKVFGDRLENLYGELSL